MQWSRYSECHDFSNLTDARSVGIWCSSESFATNSCTLLGASTEDEVSTCIRTWRKRLKNWYKDIVFMSPSHGLWWSGLWEQQMTFCQTAAWQLACLTCKESTSFVGGRISGINYGLCDSWLIGPCWQCLTFAHSILQMKSSASQEDHLFSVISADLSPAEKYSSKIPRQRGRLTSSAGMKFTPPLLKLVPFYVWMIHSGVNRDMLSFHPDFRTFHFVNMYKQ